MYHSDKVTLIEETYTLDTLGNQVASEKKRTVFADIQSVGHREFYAGAQQGMKPELKASVYAEEYKSEPAAEYRSARYSIYRTYATGDKVELYLTTKAGAQ